MITWTLFMFRTGQPLANDVSVAKARYKQRNSKEPNTILLPPQEAEYRTSLLGLKVIPADGTPGTLTLQPREFALGRTGDGFQTFVMDPRDYFESAPGKSAVRKWRMVLKKALLLGRSGIKQQKQCYCGASFAEAGCHLHEGIVYKNQAAGAHWQWMIFSSVNCILLCAKCNTSHQNVPSRRAVYNEKCKELGMEVVDQWLNSLPNKTRLPLF